MNICKAKEILDYWFSNGLYKPDYDKWFLKSQDYDKEITEKFGDLLNEAELGKGFGWLHTKESYVAYIILLDQFSRHIYRGSGDSFKNDNGVMIFVELGWEIYKKELKGYEFMFAFMPFMHTENRTYQKKGMEYFRQHKLLYKQYTNEAETIRALTKMDNMKELTNYDNEYIMLKSMEPHVIGHNQTILMFGRFPKRNELLGRESTIQENQYLNRDDVKKRPY